MMVTLLHLESILCLLYFNSNYYNCDESQNDKKGSIGFSNKECKSLQEKLPKAKRDTSAVSLCVKMANMGNKMEDDDVIEKIEMKHILVYIKVNIENMKLKHLIVLKSVILFYLDVQIRLSLLFQNI